MSDSSSSRRKQQLLDKFLAGEIDKPTYDGLLADLNELQLASDVPTAPRDSGSAVPSSPSFVVTESRTSAERSALSTPIALLEEGMELGGFQLKRRLRRGGMGEVWQAYDPTGERSVVIKVLPPELQRSPDEIARVKLTFNRVHNLQHQHICPVYLLGSDPRYGYFIVMKYLDGDTLAAYRQSYVKQHGAFPPHELIRILQPIAQALDYAHGRQIIHRDIKPQNIMLNADGNDVQLVDFGLAAEIRTSVVRLSHVQMETCGTYPYMAPEQWRGELQDARTDQYALAALAFELLAGHLPFEAADPTVLRMCVLNDLPPKIAGVPPRVNSVLARGMAKLRADRYDTCTAFVNALAAASPAKDVSATVNEGTNPPKVTPRPSPASTRGVQEIKASPPVASASKPTRPSSVNAASSSDGTRSGTTPGKRSSKSGSPVRDGVDDLVMLEPIDQELVEPDDDDDVKPRTPDRRRSSKSVKPVRGEVAMEKVNARAMLWVSLIGGSACLLFIGLFTWVAWSSMQAFFKPSQPGSSATPIQVADTGGSTTTSNPPAAQGAPGVVLPSENGVPPLRYRWEQGKPYVYSVKVEMEPDSDTVMAMTGQTTYTLGQPVANKNAGAEPGKGTGTGFVVNATGYLVTCQHVVDDASEIEVAIGGKKYPAKVVVEDAEHDLAIIQIEANGLPVLPLADSEKVQLGEEVRAIGFPFASILGDNVKATRGTISGVNQEEGKKIFQVDAGINPGNSGGPLVNERGEVVGVNFAKLREEVATNVGFAVPINDAMTLLRNEGVAVAAGKGQSPKLDGPELVKRVSAATALISVNMGGGAVAGLHHFELRCTGSLSSSVRSKSGKSVDPSAWASQRHHLRSIAFSQPDVVETDPVGRVHEITGENNPLPALMGSVSSMVLEVLPTTRRQSWSHSYAVTIVTSAENGEAFGPSRFRPRFRPPGFPGFPGFPGGGNNATRITRTPAKVRVTYTVQGPVGDLVRIKKDFDLEARDQAVGEPRFKLTGSGVFVFDTKAGIPRTLDYSALLVENEQNRTTKLPIKLSYELSSGPPVNIANVAPAPVQGPADAMKPGTPVEKETVLPVGTRLVAEWAGKWLPVAVLETKPDGRVRIHWVGWGDQFDEDLVRTRLRFPLGDSPPATQPPAVADVSSQAPLKLSAAEIDQCLADLQSKAAGKGSSAVRRLQQATPVEERRSEVLAVLEEMLKEKDPFRRKQAVEALGTWATPETVPLLLRCLDESALLVKLAAIDALGKLKDARAAEPLAKLVTQPGPRIPAAKALQMLGTKAENAVLSLLMHSEAEVRGEACRLLKDCGTAASLSALQSAINDTDRTVAASAKEAVAAISKRK